MTKSGKGAHEPKREGGRGLHLYMPSPCHPGSSTRGVLSVHQRYRLYFHTIVRNKRFGNRNCNNFSSTISQRKPTHHYIMLRTSLAKILGDGSFQFCGIMHRWRQALLPLWQLVVYIRWSSLSNNTGYYLFAGDTGEQLVVPPLFGFVQSPPPTTTSAIFSASLRFACRPFLLYNNHGVRCSSPSGISQQHTNEIIKPNRWLSKVPTSLIPLLEQATRDQAIWETHR